MPFEMLTFSKAPISFICEIYEYPPKYIDIPQNISKTCINLRRESILFIEPDENWSEWEWKWVVCECRRWCVEERRCTVRSVLSWSRSGKAATGFRFSHSHALSIKGATSLFFRLFLSEGTDCMFSTSLNLCTNSDNTARIFSQVFRRSAFSHFAISSNLKQWD